MKCSIEQVAVICDDVEAGGGAAAMVRASIRQLSRLGVAVTVLAGDDLPAPGGSVTCVDLGGRHLLEGGRLRAGLRALNDPGVARRLAAWIDAHDTPGTVYHLHNWHKVLSPSCFGALSKVTDRLVCSANDYFLACPNGGYFDYRHHALCERVPLSGTCLATNCDKRHLGHKLWRVARQLALERRIDFRTAGATVLAVHEGMVPLLSRHSIPRSAIQVLRNPISPWSRERIAAERNRALLFVGRLEVDKGIVTLARAAQRLGARLIVVGDGPLAGSLPDLCPGVELVGQRPTAELAAIASEARLIVVPTLARETFGMVAVEAATSGLPVVVSTSALIAGELAAIGAGCICPPDDTDALVDCLGGLLADDARVAAMSLRAFSAAQTLALTEDEWGDRLLALYAGVLSASRPAPAADREVMSLDRELAAR